MTAKKPTLKQEAILQFLRSAAEPFLSDGYTLDEILDAVPEARTYGPPANQKSHLRECLARLIKQGWVVRKSRGVYACVMPASSTTSSDHRRQNDNSDAEINDET